MTWLNGGPTIATGGLRHTPDNSLLASPFMDSDRRYGSVVARYTDYDEYHTLWSRPAESLPRFSPMGQSGIIGAANWDPFVRASNWTGHLGWKTISGVTRDTNGAVLGGVNVHCFRTADDLLIYQSTSDVGGIYAVYTYDTGAHYLVAYKSGTPDLSGTTANTLTGT